MPNPLRPGWGYDAATGTPVDMRKSEERVRQAYERTLHEEYGYDFASLDIEVYIQRGAATRRVPLSERADIVIYRTTDHRQRNQNRDILGIVETKRPQRNDGIRQLMTYLSATSAAWGVWTNEDEIAYIYHDPQTGELKEDYIFQIPRKGETLQDMGLFSKSDLLPARDLKPTFRRILNTLYSNTNISRREKLGSEMIRLIFTKIWDERYDFAALPAFRVSINETPKDVKARIVALFEQVKAELAHDGVFDANEQITLDPKSVSWVVGQLERYSLLKTDKDTVGDAFEVFAESKLVGEKGEFFTPREVVKTAVQLVDPQPRQFQFVVDPACGSGGFLLFALEHVWQAMDRHPHYRNSPDIAQLKRDVAGTYFLEPVRDILEAIMLLWWEKIGGRGRQYDQAGVRFGLDGCTMGPTVAVAATTGAGPAPPA